MELFQFKFSGRLVLISFFFTYRYPSFEHSKNQNYKVKPNPVLTKSDYVVIEIRSSIIKLLRLLRRVTREGVVGTCWGIRRDCLI